MEQPGICLADTEVYLAPGRHAHPPAVLPARTSVDVRPHGKDHGWFLVRVRSTGSPLTEGFARSTRIATPDPARWHLLLASNPGFRELAVPAPSDARLDASRDRREFAAASTWNRYGGLLGALAEHLGIDPGAAVAIICVESSGEGFGPDGRVVIRFENHVFRRYLGVSRREEFDRHFRIGDSHAWLDHRYRHAPDGPWRAFHGSQALEWEAFTLARAIDEDAAMRSISIGLPQVMGFNHALAGYADPAHMFAFMDADVRYQVLALFEFIRGGKDDRSPAVAALQRADFNEFAALYNGPARAQYYGDLIAAYVSAFHALRPETPPGSGRPNGQAADPRPPREYPVRVGDTLSAIAGRFGVTVAEIVAANRIANPDRIRAGERLSIPPGTPLPDSETVPAAPPRDVDPEGREMMRRNYLVRPGDTLWKIAREHGCSVPALAEANQIRDVNLILPGQILAIPAE